MSLSGQTAFDRVKQPTTIAMLSQPVAVSAGGCLSRLNSDGDCNSDDDGNSDDDDKTKYRMPISSHHPSATPRAKRNLS